MFDFSDFKERIALFLTDETSSICYGELDLLCAEFKQLIGRRCLIFIVCSNTVGAVVAYIASLQNGIVPMMLKDGLSVKALQDLINRYHPAYLLVQRSQLQKYAAFGTECADFINYVLLQIPATKDTAMHPELALLLSTSGSTSSPKTVRLSYKNLQSNTQAIIKSIALTADDRTITSLPLNYTFGLSILNTYLTVGAGVVLSEYSLMQKEFWTIMQDYAVTSLSGVPYTYQMLDRLMFTRRRLPHLQVLTQAGGKLPKVLQQKFAAYAVREHKRFYVMYGACEATARMSCLPCEFAQDKLGSCGRALEGGSFSIIDEQGAEITTPDVQGGLCYNGDNVCMGYAFDSSDLLRGDDNHGFLQTGDIAYFDADGFYYISGRRERFLKIYGNRVALDELEAALKGHFPQIDFACTGVDDALYVFTVGTDAQNQDDIKSYLQTLTHLNPQAFVLMPLTYLPKNEAGKTAYGELAKYYA